MWNFKFALALLLLCSIVSSCNSDKDVYANIMQMKSKPVTLSCDSMRLISYKNRVDTFPKQFYWVVYSDSVDCSSCRLTNLVHWNDYLDSANIFEHQNQHIPSDVLFHTFLLDENMNVVLVGDPIRNKEINKIFWDILNGKEY